MKRENIYVFLASTILYLTLGTVLNAVYFSNTTVVGLDISVYYEFRTSLLAGSTFLLLAALIMFYMSYYIAKTLQIMEEGVKKQGVEHLFWGFLYISIASLINVFLYGMPVFLDISTSIYIGPESFKIYPYVIATGFSNFFLVLGLFYIILFSLNELEKKDLTVKNKWLTLILLLLFIVSVLPTNYYALKPPQDGVYTRVLLLLIEMGLSMIIAFYSSTIAFKKARAIYDRKTRRKLFLLGLGFILFFFFLTIPVIGITLFKGSPLFVWYTIGFGIVFLAMTLIYVALVTPSWIEKYL